MVKSLNTIQHFCKSFCGKADRRGIAPPLQNGARSGSVKKNNYLCSIMPAKPLDFLFQLVPIFVGNLAQNSTRLFLSNELLLLIRSCAYNMPSFFVIVSCK